MKKIALILILLLNTAALNAQSFTVFDIDTVSFPVMKAKFYAFDGDYKQILDLSPDDFEIYEDGVEREVLSISCPEPAPPTALSSVLVMDISGSMMGTMLDKAKVAARSWVNGLPLGKSECAITSFDTKNNMLQDFTKDRNRLLEKIELLGAGGGTDYEAGFINPLSGGLLVAQTGKYKKVLVFLTDGRPNFTPDVNGIVAEALKHDVIIFAVTLDMPCPQCLIDIASRTGGTFFENVSTVENAREIYMRILQAAQGGGACEIEWESGIKCTSTNTELQIYINNIYLNYSTNYLIPSGYLTKLQFNPNGIYFQNKEPGIQHDTTIIVTAQNADFEVSNITSLNPDFDITPKSFSLKDGNSISLTISFTPTDSGYTFTKYEFINDICETKCFATGGYWGMKPKIPTLKLTHPDGGEIFAVGSDTIITWEGISPNDIVLLEYSIDSGKTWTFITDTASGLGYSWVNIPKPVSDHCIIRIKQIDMGSIDSIPEIEWQKCFGGSNYDYAHSIQQTSDEGYVVVGSTRSIDGDVSGNHKGNVYDCWILKLNLLGEIEWQKCLGGAKNESCGTIQQTSDGGYIIAGGTESNDGDVYGNHGNHDMWVVKISFSGNIEWQKCFGGTEFDVATSIQQTFDGGYIVAGYTSSNDSNVTGNHGSSDIWVVKISSSGNIVWQKCLGGKDSEKCSTIKQTIDGGYICAGETYSSRNGDVSYNHGSSDYWIVKLNNIGDIEWEKCFGGSKHDFAVDIQETYDRGYIVTGITESNNWDVSGNHGKSDYWIIKLNYSGFIEWEKCLGGSNYDDAMSIQQTFDGGYISAGSTYSKDGDVESDHNYEDYWIVKLNPLGEIKWQKCLGGSSSEMASFVQQVNDGGYIISGFTQSNDGDVSGNHGDEDAWIVKLSPEGTILQEDISDSVFAIVAPEISSMDIDMGQVLVGKTKEKYVTDFIQNIGSWECRIDSIYFQGADSAAFSLVSGIPQYTIASGANHFAEFSFRPTKAGLHEAEIVIISQADTLIQNIRGEGIEPKLAVLCDWIDFGQVYLTEHKDTVKAIIENTGTASIEITKTEISGPDIDQFEIIDGGGSFTLNPGDERELTLRFEPEYLGKTSTNLKFYHNESGSPALTQLYGEGIKNEADCDSTGFEYPNFTGVDDIILSGSTGKVDDYIRLTYANTSQAGAICHEKPVLVGNGFITEFSFRMSSGDNVNTDDGSLPGADGLAFVIQNNEDIQMGLYGGGIGYHGIENALAVEFDLFQNNSKQIIDFKDPNGNHASIQKSVDNKVSALHSSWNTVEINEDIPLLKSDGTIYYAKIEYNIEPNVMSVYLDDTGELDDPVIVAGGVKLNDIINLLQDQKAFVGITSATGNAYQIHDLLDWYFCPFPADITAVESDISHDEILFNIYPNPVSESTTIEINNPKYQYISLSITDIFGREVKSLYSGSHTPGNISFNWNTSGITDGIYFCRLNLGGENFVKAVVVSR